MREGEVTGSNPASREARAFCMKNAATYDTPNGGFPRLKKYSFFFARIQEFLEMGWLANHPYKSAIRSNGLVRTAAKTIATDQLELPLKT
jgi:hypothetical protein